MSFVQHCCLIFLGRRLSALEKERHIIRTGVKAWRVVLSPERAIFRGT